MAESNNKQVDDCCIMCLQSFGIDEKRIPCECINQNCRQKFCTECVNVTETISNGNDQCFRCLYCMHEYPPNYKPVEDRQLKTQLWEDATLRYGIHHTRHLLSAQCTPYDFIADIKYRQLHLTNLISRRKRLPDWSLAERMINEGDNMAEKLSKIIRFCDEQLDGNINQYKDDYKHAISVVDGNEDVGSRYIRLCEQLLVEISNAEIRNIFPETNAKMEEWMREMNSDDVFQPKVSDLTMAIKQDLISHSVVSIRIKIGVIGYVNVGKSSLVNSLLGTITSNGKMPSSVQSNKSAYHQLHFDRQEPLIHPEYSLGKTEATFVDIQGFDKDTLAGFSEVRAGNYLDEIRRADCDIYLLVFNEQLRYEQQDWINYIEDKLNRTCILVQSKVDRCFLAKYRELSNTRYTQSDTKERKKFTPIIKEYIRAENGEKSRFVYLTAVDTLCSDEGELALLQDQSFDFDLLLVKLGRLALGARNPRILSLATRVMAYGINMYFRRQYVLNVLRLQIAAKNRSITFFGPNKLRYFARIDIIKAFGIDEAFVRYLAQCNLTVGDDQLKTSAFNKCVKVSKVMTGSESTVILIPGIRAWSAATDKEDIVSFVHRLCNDLILVISPLVASNIECKY